MRAWGLLVLAACGRIGFAALPDGTASDSAGDSPGGSDAGSGSAGPCVDTTGDLVACFTFDGDTLDHSAHGNDATQVGVTFVPGHDGLAAAAGSASQLLIAESSSLDVDDVTIEAWVLLPVAPSAFTFLFDNDRQYAFATNPSRTLGAVGVASGAFTSQVSEPQALPVGEWHHIAMRYEAATRLDIFIDGVRVGSGSAIGPLDHNGTSGCRIAGDATSGSSALPPLEVEVDDLRIWRGARSDADLQ